MILCSLLTIVMICCAKSDLVKDYFQSHGMTYPADSAGVSLLDIKYSGIDRKEMQSEGAHDLIEDGLTFIKYYFEIEAVQDLVPGAEAIVADSPVFFRGESGEVGLMVKVTAYGEGKPGGMIKRPVEWIGEKKKFWKIENFAYFNREGLSDWQFGGWVY